MSEDLASNALSFPDILGILLGAAGVGIALFFAARDRARRIKDKKNYLEKRIACGDLLIAAYKRKIAEAQDGKIKKKFQGYRTILWLRLDTGMSDEEFYKLYKEFKDLCTKDLKDGEGEVMVRIKDGEFEKFKAKLNEDPIQN